MNNKLLKILDETTVEDDISNHIVTYFPNKNIVLEIIKIYHFGICIAI